MFSSPVILWINWGVCLFYYYLLPKFSLMKSLQRVSLLLFLSFSLIAYSQPPQGRGKMAGGFSVRGRVLDKLTTQPVEFATVAVYQSSDNSLITGCSSDVKGGFTLEEVKGSDVYIAVTFMGYKTLKVSKLPPSKDGVVDLKQLYLEPISEQLEEVAVVAKNRSIDYQLDKKVIDVASQTTSASATAVEVLENVPSVKVDIDGTVSLRGSSGFTVLIDGKPTPLDASDALRSIPASAIQKMEIITNPSAKYEPDGTSGIINVILKKNIVAGFNGIVNTNVGSYGTYGGDLLLNYRSNKLSYNIGADYNKRVFKGSSESYRRAYAMDTVITSAVGGNKSNNYSGGVKGGIDYEISPYDAISLGFRIGNREHENNGDYIYDEFFSSTNVNTRYSTTSLSERSNNWLSLNGAYTHKFVNNPEHTLKLNGDINRSTGEEQTVSEQRDGSGVLTDGRSSRSSGPRYNGQARLDYVFPMERGMKFESGYMGRWENRTAETWLDTVDLATGKYINDQLYSYSAEAYQNIQALYAIYSQSLERFSYQVGLRGEYTYRDISVTENSESFLIDQLDYFPTVHLTYNLPKDHKLALSYSRRIERVRPWDLHPFIVWTDAYNVRQGNPALENQYIDALELGYMKQYELFYFSVEGYYRITHNKVERISTVYQGNVMLQKPYNVGEDYTFGLEGSVNTTLFKIWEINLMGTLYDYQLEGEYGGRVFDKQSFNWNTRLNNTFRLGKNHQIQFNGQYNSRTATAQGENSGFQIWNGAYKVDFYDKKFSTILQVRDIFGTGQWEGFTSSSTLYNYNLFEPSSPTFTITLTYRINNYKAKRNGGSPSGEMDGGGNGEE